MTKCLNILDVSCTVASIRSALEASVGNRVLPLIDDDVWRNSRFDAYFSPLLDLAMCEHSAPMPELTDDLYADFHQTGKRLAFESRYFERRRRLSRAAISVLRCGADAKVRELLQQSLVAKLAAVGSEESWAVPAHVTVPSGKDPFTIDLFSAETANLVSELLELFGSLIPANLRDQLRQRLSTEVFNNYLERHGDFWWTQIGNNWNAVCHQGVLGAALSQLENLDQLTQMIDHARHYLVRFIDDFTEDGGCSEGPVYWEYGFGWLARLNAQLEARSAGRLSLFEGHPKMPKIARFGALMRLPGENLVNFSDCPTQHALRPSILAYLGDCLEVTACRDLARTRYQTLLSEPIELHGGRSDFTLFASLLLCYPPGEGEAIITEQACESVFLEQLNLAVLHSDGVGDYAWHFAAKAGHNDESHNHNDCGSFILNVGSVSVVKEIGQPEYVKEYFEPAQRYEFLAARTQGHSLPVINGCEQAAGEAFTSKILHYHEDDNGVELTMDLGKCYPAAAQCRQYTRSFQFNKKSPSLEVADQFELDSISALETAIITTCEVAEQDGQVILSGAGFAASLVPLPDTRLGSIERLSYAAHSGETAYVTRISFSPVDLVEQVTLAYRITPCSPIPSG